MSPSKRLTLQIQHIKNMLKEQNRMIIADVEPTESERQDMLDLLNEIKANAEAEGSSVIADIKPTYHDICNSLNELGYDISAYDLCETQTKRTEVPDEPYNNHTNKNIKHVHFNDNPSWSVKSPNLPYAPEQPSASISTYSPYKDDDNDTGLESYHDEPNNTLRQIYDENNLVMEDQDRRLERIGESVGRQRAMGEDINTELSFQNNLIEDIEAQVDRSQGRLSGLVSGVSKFNRKSRECGTCSIIMALLVVLFFVILI